MSSTSNDLRRKSQQNNPLMIGEICGKLGKTMYLGVAISKRCVCRKCFASASWVNNFQHPCPFRFQQPQGRLLRTTSCQVSRLITQIHAHKIIIPTQHWLIVDTSVITESPPYDVRGLDPRCTSQSSKWADHAQQGKSCLAFVL